MGFKNGTVINVANVNQHVVSVVTEPRPRARTKRAAPKTAPKAAAVTEAKVEPDTATTEELADKSKED